MAETKLSPLESNVPIINQDGTPNPFFIQWLQQLRDEKEVTDQVASEALETAEGAMPTSELQVKLLESMGGDPNADRIIFWDDSEGAYKFLIPGSNLTITDDTLNASGGGGGGAAGALLPFPTVGVNCTLSSGAFGIPIIIVVSAFAARDSVLNGAFLPVVSAIANAKIRPVLYGGIDPKTTQPNPAGATLLEYGAEQSMASASMNYCPFDAPIDIEAGKFYWLGFTMYGASGSINLATLGATRRHWYNSGTHNPPPATYPTSLTVGSTTNVPYWTD